MCSSITYIITYSIAMTAVDHKSDFELTKTAHSSPLRVSYGVYFVSIWEKIDGIITALHCMMNHIT